MKKYLVFLCAMALVFSVAGVTQATPINVDLQQYTVPGDPPRSPVTPYGAGTLTYGAYGPTFMGSLTVSDLTEGMVYQIKLEGMPEDDWDANLNLGSIGRWWEVDTTISGGNWMGRNLDDTAVQPLLAIHDTDVKGYILFDSFLYTGGEVTIPFYLNSSYHIPGVPEPDRPAPGEVVMPDGVYNVSFLLTENNRPWESPLHADVSFEVGAPVPEPATMLLLGSGLIGLAGLGRRKFFKKS